MGHSVWPVTEIKQHEEGPLKQFYWKESKQAIHKHRGYKSKTAEPSLKTAARVRLSSWVRDAKMDFWVSSLYLQKQTLVIAQLSPVQLSFLRLSSWTLKQMGHNVMMAYSFILLCYFMLLNQPDASTPKMRRRLHRCSSWRWRRCRRVWQPVWSSNISLQRIFRHSDGFTSSYGVCSHIVPSVVACRIRDLPLVRALGTGAKRGINTGRWLFPTTSDRSGFGYIWAPSEHTFFTTNWSFINFVIGPIKELDFARKVIVGIVPIFGRDPQSAGDSVVMTCLWPLGSVVRRHTICDILCVDFPVHADMVRVEFTGHTNQGLLSCLVFLVSALFWWRFEHFDFWFGYIRIYERQKSLILKFYDMQTSVQQ